MGWGMQGMSRPAKPTGNQRNERLALTSHDWLQIEQAAAGCVSGTSDDWPDLRVAIEKVTGDPFGRRRTAAWLQGFCEGFLIQSGR